MAAIRYKFAFQSGLRAAILAISPNATVQRSGDYVGVLIPSAESAAFTIACPASPIEVTDGLADGDGTGLTDTTGIWDDLIREGTWINPGANKIGVTPVYAAGEWSLSLLGGAGTNVSDPLSGPHLIGPPLTTCADGSPLDTTDVWSILMLLTETNAPALTSDILIAMGFVNEDVDSGTIEGVWAGILYSGSTRVLVRGSLANGTNSQANGSTSTSIRGCLAPAYRVGNDAAALWDTSPRIRPIDSAGAVITGAPAAAGDLATGGGTALPRPFIAAWRTTATDLTTRGLAFKARRGPIAGLVLP